MKFVIIVIVLVLLFSGAVDKAEDNIGEALGLSTRPWLRWLIVGAILVALLVHWS